MKLSWSRRCVACLFQAAVLVLQGGCLGPAKSGSGAGPGGAGTLDPGSSSGAPVVTLVTSSVANGTYFRGQTIPILVVFDKPVTVTRTPKLKLALQSGQPHIDFVDGTGTTTLTFSYTIGTGHSSGDLDIASATALQLNGGTIQGADGTAAVLTLPAPGASGSLSASKDIVIDGLATAVTNVTSSTANGTYGAGQAISVQVTFSRAVTVHGVPKLSMRLGTVGVPCSYVSGSGTDTLTFTYTVAPGHGSADLSYDGTSALALNGGTLKDGAAKDVALVLPTPGAAGSLSANKNIVIDAVAPGIVGVAAANAGGTYGVGSTISLLVTFNEPVYVTSGSSLSISLASGGSALYTSGSGTTVLTFAYEIATGHTASPLEYIDTSSFNLSGATLRDATGNNAVMELPVPGAAGSLSASSSITVVTPAGVFTLPGTENNALYGYAVAGGVDINTDGKSDYVIGAPYASSGEGRAYAGSVLGGFAYTLSISGSSGAHFGWSVGMGGDYDGDGRADLIAGAPHRTSGAGGVAVFSGATGSSLYETGSGGGSGGIGDTGLSVAGVGDIDGNGRADFIMGSPSASTGGNANIGFAGLLGASGSYFGTVSGAKLGYAVSAAGDVDGDGRADVIVGEPFSVSGGGITGRAYVYSGMTGAVVRTLAGGDASGSFGAAVAGVGDVNADGRADVIVGAPGAGKAFVYSGMTGGVLYSLSGNEGASEFGFAVAGVGDVNGDGRPDFAVGAPSAAAGGTSRGRVYVYSGATGAQVYTVAGTENGGKLGFSVARAGDVSADGRGDVMVGQPYAAASGTQRGKVYIFISR